MNDNEFDVWDEKLASNPDGGNVFQTAELGDIKHAVGWTPLQLTFGSVNALVIQWHVPLLGNFWYVPKGPGVTSVADLRAVLPKLREAAAAHGVFVVKIEPEIHDAPDISSELASMGLVKVRAIQPNSSTVIVSLQDEADTLASFGQRARRGIRKAQQEGVTVKPVECTEESMQKMYDLLHATSVGKFAVRPFSYYQKFWSLFSQSGRGQLFLAYYNGEAIAGAYVMMVGKKAAYKDGGSVREKVAQSAGYLLQWEIMRWLIQKGATEYDLHGAPHSTQVENTADKQYGLGIFKTSFNKQITDYVGAFDLPLKPLAYKLWTRIGERVMLKLYYKKHHQSWY